MKLVILHSRPAVGETVARSLRFAYHLNAVYIEAATAIDMSHQQEIIILTDFANLEKLLQTGSLPKCPVLLLTDAIENDNVVEALFVGVAGIIDLSKGPEVLVEKTQQVLQQQTDDGNILIQKLLGLNYFTDAPSDNTDYSLTQKEREILKLMRESNHLKQIAHLTNTSYETVRTHVKHIYKKLGVMSASEAVIKAMKMEL